MKKKIIAIGLLSIITVMSLFGCSDITPTPSPCKHVDENPKDFICDLCGEKLSEPTDLAITSHPKDVQVTLPKGCSFSVEVNNEKLVKSYMWQVYNGDIPDGEGPLGPTTLRGEEVKEQWLDLDDCSSGRTNTYVKTNTINKFSSEVKYRCKITDINDNVIYSNEAHLTYTNPEFNGPMLQVASYVLLEGDILDLSKTELGTGIISYISRDHIKLIDVKYSNELPISDSIESGTDGIMVYEPTYTGDDFKVTLVGDNVIHNVYWDPDYKAGGIGLNFFFGKNNDGVKCSIEGSGKIAFTGGSHAIYCPGPLEIKDTEIILNTIGSNYGTGIYAYKVTLDNSKVSGKVNGSVIHNINQAGAGIEIKNGSSVNAIIRPQHPSVGGTIALGLVADDSFSITDSSINIAMHVAGKEFDEKHAILGAELLGCNHDVLSIYNSNISLSFTSDADLEGMCTEVYGIMGKCRIHYSNVDIRIISPETVGACGIGGSYFVLAYSTLNIECRASGDVYGFMNSNDHAEFLFSKININTESYDGGYSLGLMWWDNVIQDATFVIDTIDGVAYACFSRTSSEDMPYDPSYTIKHMDASKIKVMNFNDSTINRYSIYFEGTGKYNVVETIYSLSDTTHPASSLIMFISK